MNILGRMMVLPNLPTPISRLGELSQNLYWTWTPQARALFRSLDPDLWEETGHSPVILLRDIPQARLEECARDQDYLKEYRAVIRDFDAYLSGSLWYGGAYRGKEHVYAYFCAEYGWHEGVALYSGGLGVLAGDHTKAASDLGVPLVGVGLWYPEGYFHQRVAADGQQEAVYLRKSPYDLPLELVTKDGAEVRVSVSFLGRDVQLRAWKITAGRVPIYLLDTDVPENDPEDRALLRRLYGGDQRTRIAQEIILGMGGVRLLRALGVAPTTWHMNEGHSAFMALERCRELVEQGLSFEAAREAVAANTIFTVHTPVAAGNDAFPFDLMSHFFNGFWHALGLSQHEFLELGRHDHGWGPVFSMPALAIRFSSGRNGVAELHGDTTRRLWRSLWPGVPVDEVPIGHVTNGVHAATWVAPEVQALVSEVLPRDWRARLDDAEMWSAVRGVDAAALWEVRKTLKAQSVRFLRRRVLKQLTRQGATPTAMHGTGDLFDAGALTIGFARRFATYKRATLIFRDLDRLARILGNPERPVQLVFAGKAHPADKPGQELISIIHNLSSDERFKGRILFVEDYDMAVGRALTRGCDVWLNNPRRPLEASGTSGQKAAMNGLLNLSILDGWWPEGYDGLNGWAIGEEQTYADETRADLADADALYDLLEREVVPLYYDRDERGVPQGWLTRAADAIATVSPAFNASRMVKDYVREYYAPASERGLVMAQRDHRAAAELAEWRRRVRAAWDGVRLHAQEAEDSTYRAGETLEIGAVLYPGDLADLPLCVEVVYGHEDDDLNTGLHTATMEPVETLAEGAVRYRARFTPEISGRIVYGVRAYPVNPLLGSPFDAHAIRWAHA
jgi:glycogen phosphorylase